jgi:hypothetical protein
MLSACSAVSLIMRCVLATCIGRFLSESIHRTGRPHSDHEYLIQQAVLSSLQACNPSCSVSSPMIVATGVSAAAGSASAIFGVVSGGSGAGMGRVVSSVQFLAWTAGLAGAFA